MINVERLIAVVQPLRVATLSTAYRARLLILSLTLLCFALGAFPLWTVGSQEHCGKLLCNVVERSSYEQWLIPVVVVMTLILQSCIIIVCSAVIVYYFSRTERFRRDVSLFRTFCRLFAVITARLRVMQRTVLLSQFCLSVCLSACLSEIAMVPTLLNSMEYP